MSLSEKTDAFEALSAHLNKLPKKTLVPRLAEVMLALEEAEETFTNINIAAISGGELMDAKKRGGREKLDYIEREALGGWGDAVGMLEIGWWTSGMDKTA